MIDNIVDNITTLGPGLAFFWIVTIALTIWRPQKYFNSLMLMFSIFLTMLFMSGFFGDDGRGYFLMVCFILVMIALMMVPVMLIINGIVMIKKESVCVAHLLSLGLGIFVGIGEIAVILYVLGLSNFAGFETLGLWNLFIAFTVFYFSCLVLSFVIYSIFIQFMPHRMNFNYIIIHGAGLAGGETRTRLLQNRVDKAIEVYEKCSKKPVIIPSGGKGEDEKISEAQAMKNYLLTRGVPEENIVLEDKSTTTKENLQNSGAIIAGYAGKRRTALVSSNYHIYRCLRIAKEIKMNCVGIGAKVAFYYWPSALIREFAAVFLTKRFFIWSMIGYVIFISPVIWMIFN